MRGRHQQPSAPPPQRGQQQLPRARLPLRQPLLAPSLPHPLVRRVLALVLRLQLRRGAVLWRKSAPPLPKRQLAQGGSHPLVPPSLLPPLQRQHRTCPPLQWQVAVKRGGVLLGRGLRRRRGPHRPKSLAHQWSSHQQQLLPQMQPPCRPLHPARAMQRQPLQAQLPRKNAPRPQRKLSQPLTWQRMTPALSPQSLPRGRSAHPRPKRGEEECG